MKELNLILVRHGETDYNVPPRKFQGQFDTILNSTGETQANLLCNKIAASYLQFNKIYCSDLKRTRQTIEPYLVAKGADISSEQVEYVKELRERDIGIISGLSVPDARKVINFNETIEQCICRTGENESRFKGRFEKFLVSVINEHLINSTLREETILLVTHGGVLQFLNDFFPPNFNLSYPRNCSLYHIKLAFNENSKKQTLKINGLEYDWIIYNNIDHLSNTQVNLNKKEDGIRVV